jgi:hypothetical protein
MGTTNLALAAAAAGAGRLQQQRASSSLLGAGALSWLQTSCLRGCGRHPPQWRPVT